MNFDFFTSNLSKYANEFSPSALMGKIGQVAIKAGRNTVYSALSLFYGMNNKNMSATDKLLIAAALGYFILPIDAIPDILPGGLVDDGGVIALAARSVWKNINDVAREKSKEQLHKWFGDFDESGLINNN